MPTRLRAPGVGTPLRMKGTSWATSGKVPGVPASRMSTQAVAVIWREVAPVTKPREPSVVVMEGLKMLLPAVVGASW